MTLLLNPSRKETHLDNTTKADKDNNLSLALKNKTVRFTSQRETADGLFGTFTSDGRVWNGIIPRLSQKERKRLINHTFNAKVISCKSEDAIILSLLK